MRKTIGGVHFEIKIRSKWEECNSPLEEGFDFRLEEGVSMPSRNTFSSPRPGLYFNVVVVAASLRVNEIEGFAGI